MADLSHLKADFPILTDGVHFLDSGASSQMPIPVLEAMDAFARTSYANVHRGAYKLSVAATDAYEAARERVARFIGAADSSEVVFTRGATTALNMVGAKLAEAAQRYPAQMVYFITDVQKATWTSLPPTDPAQETGEKTKLIFADIQQRARTVFVDVGRDAVDNVAVTDLGIEVPFVTTGMKAPIVATVRNFGKENKTNVRVELLVGKAREAANDAPLSPRVVGQELANLRAGEPVPIPFFYSFPEPGTYAIQVRLGDDPLNLDNVRSVIVTVLSRSFR